MSGIDTVVPSMILTWRPFQRASSGVLRSQRLAMCLEIFARVFSGSLARGFDLGIGTGVPSLHAADDFPAGGVWGKNLSKKGPEEHGQAVLALAAEIPFGCRNEEIIGNRIRTDRFKIA